MIAREAAGRDNFWPASSNEGNEGAFVSTTSAKPVLLKLGKARHQLGQPRSPALAPSVSAHPPLDLGAECPSSALAFYLFILVNAVLLIRPAEILPELRGIELYFYAIAACSLFAASDVLKYLIGRPLDTQPITLCVLLLFGAVLLPHLVGWRIDELWVTGFHYFKQLVYFMLLVSLVNTPGRLRTFLACLLAICSVIVVVALLDYHQIITLATLKAVQDSDVSSWGEVTTFDRLKFTGILNDPNEVCVWLATLLPLALCNLLQARDVLRRGVWLALIVLYGYAIYLTHSRGGFLAMVAGLGAAVGTRYGRQRATLLAAIGLPLLLLLFAGRQTTFDTSAGTGQSRVRIWSDWLDRFRGNPLVGEGMSFEDLDPAQLAQLKALGRGEDHVAHNSFLQVFADVGFAGGCLFLGAFGVALWSVWGVGRRAAASDSPARAVQPFLLGAIAAYCVGMLTLSLWVVTPTYIVLALAAVYPRVCRSNPPQPPLRFDVILLGRFALAGVAYLAAIYVFVRLFVNWG
jgi:putative inorganic carbon (hco3(-)) transporter